MRRTKEAALETRAKILESALDIFSEKNFSNASLTAVSYTHLDVYKRQGTA